MKRHQYLQKRNEIYNRMKTMIDTDDFDQAEFDELKEQIDKLDAEWEKHVTNEANLETIKGKMPSVDPVVDITKGEEVKEKMTEKNVEDKYATKEYRAAFMNYITKGTPISKEFLNAGETTVSGEVPAVIPSTMVREIVRELKERGAVWANVRKFNIPGGVEVPISDIIPKANWIGEDTPSNDQKLTAKKSISFSYYGLECKLSQSILTSVVTIDEFENLFTELAIEAIFAALEIGVFNGSGTGQMKGILNETRIPAGNTIELAEADIKDFATWKKKVFAKMKKAYRKGTFFMAQGTFDTYIDGMVDKNGQPIGRVNYGIDGEEVYRFSGKPVETVEDDVLKAFDDANTGEVFAVFGDLKNYAVNSNLQMTAVKWTDNDNNKVKNKVIMICDGKVLDPNGFLILKKKA